MTRVSPRFFVALGLGSVLASALLLAMFLDLIPDRLSALSRGRGALAEAIAISTANSVNQSNIAQVKSTLSFMVERNPELLSAALRSATGEVVASVGEHDLHWSDVPGSYSTDSQVQVPILKGQEKWGHLELRFTPLIAPGWLGIVKDPRVEMICFVVGISLVGFYFYLGRVLRELDPARAIPGRVRDTLDTMAEGLLVVDREGHIVLANQAFANMVRQKPEDLIGRTTSGLAWLDLSGCALPSAAYPWTEAISSGTPQRNGRLCLRDSVGKLHSFIVNASPLVSSGKRHDGVLISFDDVTELQDKEIELRTAKYAAESANRAKTDFLTNISHEIRTPMNAILGFTDLLRCGYQRHDGDLQRHLDIIHSSGEHLLELINDILDLAKVESGHLDIEKSPCAPHQIMREVVEMLAIRSREKNIAVHLNCASPVPELVVTDPGRLRQAITNLIGNAIKFTERGHVNVTMELRLAGDERLIAIDVADTGIGIEPEKLESIFEPFVQAEASITRKYGGTGLGLTISRRFARAMGGDIAVRSVAGKGSVFTLTFDSGSLHGVRMLRPDEAMAPSCVSQNKRTTHWEFPASHVLVVDDSAANRELVRVVLQRSGIRVSEAENGEQCVQKSQLEHFDAILMDMQMPVMDGYTATRILRSRDKETPVIALTAHAMAPFEQEILDAGCTGYLAKPIDIELLLSTLAEVLGGRRVTVSRLKEANRVPILCDDDRQNPTTPLISLWANDPELHDAARKFADQVPERLLAMEKAWRTRDFTTLSELAHWLKGSGGTAGFPDFTAPARLIEELAQRQALDEVEEVLAEVHKLGRRMAAFYGRDAGDGNAA